MEQKILDWLNILAPLFQVIAALAVPVVAARIYGWLGVKAEKDQTEIEKMLRDALHQSAANGLAYALNKLKLGQTVPLGRAQEIATLAASYVEEKNPEAIAKLGVTAKQLNDIIFTKFKSVEKPPG